MDSARLLPGSDVALFFAFLLPPSGWYGEQLQCRRTSTGRTRIQNPIASRARDMICSPVRAEKVLALSAPEPFCDLPYPTHRRDQDL